MKSGIRAPNSISVTQNYRVLLEGFASDQQHRHNEQNNMNQEKVP